MENQKSDQSFEPGTHVKIINSGFSDATIAEYRGRLGPHGAPIYRVMVQRKPRPVYIEVREDQLERICPS